MLVRPLLIRPKHIPRTLFQRRPLPNSYPTIPQTPIKPLLPPPRQTTRPLTTTIPNRSLLGLNQPWHNPKVYARPDLYPYGEPRQPTPYELAARKYADAQNPKNSKVYPCHIPSARARCKDPVGTIARHQLSVLDPDGARARLFDGRNREGVKVGDILLVRTRDGEPFHGVVIDIRRRGVDTGVLLRDQATRVGVEMWFKVFSPNVEGVEVVQRRVKRARRARLYYMRLPKHDLGSTQNIVQQYLRQRSVLRTGGEAKGRDANTNKRKKRGK